MAAKPKAPPGYIGIGKRYIALSFLLTLSAGLLALLALYATTVHPIAVQAWLDMQDVPEFTVDSPYLANYSGHARLVLPDGTCLYEGAVSDAAANGEGRLFENGVLIYEGGFVSNMFSGFGRLYQNGVLVYEGGFEANVFEGHGRQFENNRLVYEGDFAEGLYDGGGKLYEKGALLYEGEFAAGQYNGMGSEYNTETGFLLFTGRYSEGMRMEAGTLYDENGNQIVITDKPASRPIPLSLLGMRYADVLDRLKLADVTPKEQAVGDALFALDEAVGVIYSFRLLPDGSPDSLSCVYYYGLAYVGGVVVGADVSDIPGGTPGAESVKAGELLVLAYSNALWGRDALASALRSMVFGTIDNYAVTAFYIPPEQTVLARLNEDEPQADEPVNSEPGIVEPSGQILFIRVDYSDPS